MIKRSPALAVLKRPTPLARLRGKPLQLVRAPLERTHLIFLLCAALYVIYRHPDARQPVAILAAIAGLAQVIPGAWRKFFVAEGLLLIGGLISFMAIWDRTAAGGGISTSGHNFDIFAGWVRMVFVAWILVPARPGYLRWFAALVGVELAISTLDSPFDMRSIALTATALAGLAWDAHLRVAVLRPADVTVGRSRRASTWRWCGIICALVMIVTVPIVSLLDRLYLPTYDFPQNNVNQPVSVMGPNRLDTRMNLGDSRYGDQNPVAMARLEFEHAALPDTYYLRASALPELQLDGYALAWVAAPNAIHPLPDQPQLHGASQSEQVTVWRRRALGDKTVLLPSGSGAVGLADCFGDIDGNIYREGLGDIDTRYQAAVGDLVAPPSSWTRPRSQRNREIPYGIEQRFIGEVPLLDTWRSVEPHIAALGISAWLQSRSRYQLSGFPEPRREPAGDIMRFMFDEDPAMRVGHCQYFATATVLLLRAAGHHARCVIGYTSDEIYDNRVIFRALNAHAWVEVLTTQAGQDYWQRVDPTPPDFLQQRRDGLELEDPQQDQDESEDDATDEALTGQDSDTSWDNPWLLIGLMVVIGTGGCMWWWNRSDDDQNKRERVLARHTESLIKAALECGVPIQPSSSLTSIAESISARTGIDLSDYLTAHLEARFNNGPLPRSWPLTQIREASAQLTTSNHHTASTWSR